MNDASIAVGVSLLALMLPPVPAACDTDFQAETTVSDTAADNHSCPL